MKKRFILGISIFLLLLTGTIYLMNKDDNDTPLQPSVFSEETPASDPQTNDSAELSEKTDIAPGEQTNPERDQAISKNQPTQTPTYEPATKPTTAPTPPPKAPTPTPTPPPKQNPQIGDEKQRMLNLINNERVKAGLAPLKADLIVQEVAQVKAGDMVKNNYFSHTSPTYGSPFDMLRKFGVTFSAAAENIALNSSVEAAHSALMASEGHRKNILNPSYTTIGIGITDSPKGKIFVQMFIKK